MTATKRAMVAALAGVLSFLAFEPLRIRFAMVLGVAMFLWVLLSMAVSRKREVLGIGAAFGAGFMIPLIWWMNAVAHGAYVALVISQIIVFAVLALCLRRTMRLTFWPLWGAAVWVAVEAVRSNFPFSGFPWGRLTYSSIDTPFAAYTRLIGMSAVSAIMFLVAATIALALCHRGKREVVVAALTTGVVLGVGALMPTGIAGGGQHKQVALIQGDVPVEFAMWEPGAIFIKHVAETRKLLRKISADEAPSPDFVLWPENATDQDPKAFPEVAKSIESLSARLDAPILVGGIFNGPTSKTAYNAGQVWDADGPGESYVKKNLVPYGEYVPFRSLIKKVAPAVTERIPRDFLPGDSSGALSIDGVVIGDTICWDVAYDSAIRSDVRGGAQVIVVQTSNASFTGTSQPAQQWDISRLRAIETGRFVLVPSTNGISGVVDPRGDVVAKAPIRQPATVSAQIQLANDATLGIRIGGYLEALLVALGLIGIVMGRPRTKERP